MGIKVGLRAIMLCSEYLEENSCKTIKFVSALTAEVEVVFDHNKAEILTNIPKHLHSGGTNAQSLLGKLFRIFKKCFFPWYPHASRV